MAQIAKIEVQAEIKSSTEKLYGFFKNQMGRLVQMFPQNFKSCEILGGGNALTSGTIMSWKYDLGSGPMSVKLKVEDADEENKSISFVVLDGDLLKLYNTFKPKIHIFKDSNGNAQIKWSIEFDKANQNAPSPSSYLDLAIKVSKGLDAYLYNN
ncbi:MLP-like protein 34 isoform X1 [Ziziphus jujuba]|uniref:MLP-like protein 34 isoform X1 n=1 Tax=Ziziphus jujuba TaxID=326968 RepID=A0ABM3IGS8_ZIZJJ|nr:MLP-like protein 34 isoform X1 [Ziziphus jujuba]